MQNLSEMKLQDALECPEIISKISAYTQKRKEFDIVFETAQIAKQKHLELDAALKIAGGKVWEILDALGKAEMKSLKKSSDYSEEILINRKIKELTSRYYNVASDTMSLTKQHNLAKMKNIYNQELVCDAEDAMHAAYHDIFAAYHDIFNNSKDL